MAPQSILDDYSADPKDRAAEAVYQLTMLNLSKTNNEMIIPTNVVDLIGPENMNMLRKRFAYVPQLPRLEQLLTVVTELLEIALSVWFTTSRSTRCDSSRPPQTALWEML